MRSSRARFLVGIAILALSVALAPAQNITEGKAFPDFKERDVVTGKPIELEQLRGKVVLIDFWATWCGPCRAELPNVKKAYEKFKKQGFEIVSISLDSDVEKCKDFVQKEGMNWLHIADGGGWKAKLAVKHNINSIPRAVLLGRDGKVVADQCRGEALLDAVEKALKAKYDAKAAGGADDDIEKTAKAQLRKADDLREKGKFAEAIALYDEIGTKYAGRPTAKTANERARELREDPAIAKALDKPAANGDAEQSKATADLLNKARQMVSLQKYDVARKYFQKIIDQYPKSKDAETAKSEMDKLPA